MVLKCVLERVTQTYPSVAKIRPEGQHGAADHEVNAREEVVVTVMRELAAGDPTGAVLGSWLPEQLTQI